ncbi:hypothetical protein AALA83_16775 [Oscillospiraceae bacterium 44-5]
MNIFEVTFENWYTIIIRMNWVLIVLIVAVLFFVARIVRKRSNIQIDQITLGIGDSTVSFSYDIRDREIAYKLWIEMNTRKIGNTFVNDDVIVEVYNSWYSFFQIARDLLKDVPVRKVKKASTLIDTTTDILNKGLRPHLTKWQARFRRWFSSEIEKSENQGKTPQEIQQSYPHYAEMIEELRKTNEKMLAYKSLLQKIAFND